MKFLRLIVLACAAMLFGCAGSAPLPKRAAIDLAGPSGSFADFSATVADADIVYFPSERAASAGGAEPAAQVLEAFAKNGAPFAIAWDLISANEQPLLDGLATQSVAAREAAVARLELAGNGRARAHCRAVLVDPRFAQVREIALKLPAGSDNAPAPLGTHFRLPPGGLETFAERMSAADAQSGGDVAAMYRARVASEQFAAEQIVRHSQQGGGGKLLAFVAAEDLESGQGIPFYVGQKLSVRQVVLGPTVSRSGNARLMTEAGRARGRSLEIVDRAPSSGRD